MPAELPWRRFVIAGVMIVSVLCSLDGVWIIETPAIAYGYNVADLGHFRSFPFDDLRSGVRETRSTMPTLIKGTNS